jgi:hypothetical protein
VNATTLLTGVARLAPSLHKAGTFSTATLEAILRHGTEKPVHHSVETGSGASTLLFSHLSEQHTVFALDGGDGSIRSIENHPLIRKDIVTFVEGPTQLTLPKHSFPHRLQLALIDGPHGYPFPDLEYYYIYPHLDTGALLIVDDIHIPTIGNLFEFLKADDMYDLRELVENTAFFRRTGAETFSPVGDGWSTQGFNKRAFESVAPERVQGPLPERIDYATPFFLDQLGPVSDPARVEAPVLPSGEDLIVSGWALDARAGRPAAAVDLVIDGVCHRSAVRIARADVSTHFGNPRYVRCGFSARVPAAVLSPGRHELEMRVVLNGEREYCSAVHIAFLAR